MENNSFVMPPFASKYVLRSTGEEVEVVAYNQPNNGARTKSDEIIHEPGDWVTYIDSQGKEHIREHLNIQLDFKPIQNDLFNKMLEFTKPKYPTERNRRIFEVAKELVKNGSHVSTAVNTAIKLVDEIGIDNE